MEPASRRGPPDGAPPQSGIEPRQSTVKRSINGTLPQGLHDAEASPRMDALTELELVLSGKTSDPAAQAKAQGTAGVQGRAGSGATDGRPAAPRDPTP